MWTRTRIARIASGLIVLVAVVVAGSMDVLLWLGVVWSFRPRRERVYETGSRGRLSRERKEQLS